jgi:hypothetical protein
MSQRPPAKPEAEEGGAAQSRLALRTKLPVLISAP